MAESAGSERSDTARLPGTVRKAVRKVRAVLHADHTLRVELIDRYGKVSAAFTITDVEDWESAKDAIGPEMNRHGIAYANWKLIDDSVTYEADVGTLGL